MYNPAVAETIELPGHNTSLQLGQVQQEEEMLEDLQGVHRLRSGDLFKFVRAVGVREANGGVLHVGHTHTNRGPRRLRHADSNQHLNQCPVGVFQLRGVPQLLREDVEGRVRREDEDVVQEVVLEAVRALRLGRLIPDARGWLHLDALLGLGQLSLLHST